MIKTVYEKQLKFYQTGMKDGPKEEQLQHFSEKLAEYAKSNISLKTPETFYFAFIEQTTSTKKETWLSIIKSASYQTWAGYAFESLCLTHIEKIKRSLGISGIFSNESGFIIKGTEQQPGLQIDLLIDRDDRAINLCEMKYYNAEFEVTKEYAQKLRIKRERFKTATGTKKHIFITLVTTYGLITNEHSLGLVEKLITLDDFF